MKILHLNACRELFAGHRKQLQYEYKAASKLESITWDIVAFQVTPPQDVFVNQYPWFFRPLFLRKLYTWLYLLRNYSKYDLVVLRYTTFDPFLLLFGFFVRNRFSVHHAKAVEELKLVRLDWRGKVASLLERFTGFINSRQVKGVLGVTREIAEYEIAVHKANCFAGVYPNGIDTEQVELLEDHRGNDIHIAFMCGKFMPWHGLDRLLEAVEQYETALPSELEVTIHLIGILNTEQLQYIQQLNLKYINVLCHGHMSNLEYRDILAKCNLGLDSLSLDLKGLSEATALKAREYLASGLPVYSAFYDGAIPKDFPYYQKGPINMHDIIAYAQKMKHITREEVRKESIPYIEKYNIMVDVCDWLKKKK